MTESHGQVDKELPDEVIAAGARLLEDGFDALPGTARTWAVLIFEAMIDAQRSVSNR